MALHEATETSLVQDNLQRMHELDDAWNAQDWKTVARFHAEDVVVFWPGGGPPTRGNPDHIDEARTYATTFPDNRVENRPYQVEMGRDDWTCTVATHTGTFRGPLNTPQGVIQPTGKSFRVDFCTVARWRDGRIVEEKLFYDLMGVLQQIGAA